MNGKSKTIELSFDDGDRLDKKVIRLLNKYNLSATFFVPVQSWGYKNIDIYKDHEVGGHTISHPADLKELDAVESQREVQLCKTLLESKTQKEVNKFCYPRGRYSKREVEFVEKAGYKEARTTKVLAAEYSDPYQKPTTVHIYERREYNKKDWMDVAMEYLKRDIEYFHLWGHSWEIEKYKQWDKLKKVLQKINNLLPK